MSEGSGRSHVRWNLVREKVAEILGLYHDGSYPVDVMGIAEEMGIKVQSVHMDDSELSGFFFRDPKSGEAVIGFNANNSQTRQRFTLAHELGHYVLHDSRDMGFDRKGYSYGFGVFMKRDSESSKGEKRDEVEANFFAAELLMPRDAIFEKLVNGTGLDFLEQDFDNTVREVAKEFGVSAQALTVRLIQLRIIEAF